MLRPRPFTGAVIGVLFLTLLLWLISAFYLSTCHVSLANIFIYLSIGLLATILFSSALVLCGYLFQCFTLPYQFALMSLFTSVYYFFIPNQSMEGMTFITIWLVITVSALGKGLDILVHKKKWTIKTAFLLGVGIFGLSAFVLWITFDQKPLKLIEDEPNLFYNHPLLEAQDPSLEGDFSVATLNYGQSNAYTIQTNSVDGSALISGWDGIEGYLRTNYLGFDIFRLPLQASVFYPLGNGPFPLVLIVHGNHEMSTPSETGYDYLCKLWASRGFIAVSVDENFLNGGWIDLFDGIYEAPARGWLLLEHLSLWRQWNGTKGHLFHKKIDMERIALIGHSRGGEAIATAALFNHLDRYPDNGNVVFDYKFNILALGAIAPVEAQYKPSGMKIELENIDYLAIQGSHDGDLRGFFGDAQYHRIKFNDSTYHYKTTLYLFHANHTQFNSVWGNKDVSEPSFSLFNKKFLMSKEQQQHVAKVYLTALLEISLHKKKEYLALFLNRATKADWLKPTYYLNQFIDSTYNYLIEGYKNVDITKTFIKGGHIDAKNFSVWTQDQVVLKTGTSIGRGLYLGWENSTDEKTPAIYKITLKEKSLDLNEKMSLSLCIADADESELDNLEWLDFTIELADAKGHLSRLLLSSYAFIKPSSYACIMKTPFLDPFCKKDQVFQTFEFPLSAFKIKNPLVNLENIATLSLIFNVSKRGNIIINNIAFHDNLSKIVIK